MQAGGPGRQSRESSTASSLVQSGVCLSLNMSLSHTHRCAYNKLTYGHVHKKTSHRCTDDSVHKQKHMYCVCMLLFSYIYLHIIMLAALLYIRISDDYRAPQVGRRKKGKWGRMFLNTELKMCIWLDLLEQQRIYTHSQTHCLGRCILSLYQPLNL